MKLYFTAGACSQAVRIALHEAGLAFEAVSVDLRSHKTADGQDYYQINPKGYVPLIELDNGERICEAPVLLQWVADHTKTQPLLAPAGEIVRYHALEWLNFVATELHKSFTLLIKPGLDEAAKNVVKQQIHKRLTYVDAQLAGRDYLLGSQFTVADIYMYVACRWAALMQMDASELKNLAAFSQRVGQREAVKKALKEEGF